MAYPSLSLFASVYRSFGAVCSNIERNRLDVVQNENIN